MRKALKPPEPSSVQQSEMDESLWTNCHADLVRKVAECKPCKWYLAATIKRWESVYNQPITHLWLQGPKPPALSNLQYYPSMLIKQEAPVLQVSVDLFIQPVQGHWAAGLCDFDTCGQSPTWIWSQHLMVIKTCHIWSKYIICWKCNALFWPKVLTTLLVYRTSTELKIRSA